MTGMGFRLGALLGWGIVIYAVMFLLWSAFITYGFVGGFAPRVLALIVLVATTIVAGRSLHVHSWHDILPYSLSWGIMMAVFDGLMSVPLTGWQVFADWNVWFGYAVVVVGPLLALYPRFGHFPASTTSSV